MRISDWSSDVCSSDLEAFQSLNENHSVYFHKLGTPQNEDVLIHATPDKPKLNNSAVVTDDGEYLLVVSSEGTDERYGLTLHPIGKPGAQPITRSEEHTSELQSLMRISYAVLCLKNKKNNHNQQSVTLHEQLIHQ